MDHPLRRLIVIAFLVSITFSSCAQNETVSEDDAERIICLPGTNQCNSQNPGNNPKLNEETIDDSPVQASAEDDDHENACIPGTTQCNNPHPGDNPKMNKEATTDSPGQASGEEDASKSEPSTICDPITKLCEGPSTRIVCNPITHICTQPKSNSFVSESDIEEQTKDDSVIHEEKEKISPLVCDPHTGNCQDPHNSFGVAQPRDEVA